MDTANRPTCKWVASCSEPAVGAAIAWLWWGIDLHLACPLHLQDARTLGMKVTPLPLFGRPEPAAA